MNCTYPYCICENVSAFKKDGCVNRKEATTVFDSVPELDKQQIIIDQQAAENERLKQQLECEMDITKQVQQERDELKAYIEDLRYACDVSIHWGDIAAAFRKTPPQSLAEIKAQAVESFLDDQLRSACLAYGWNTDSDAYQVSQMLEEYANQLRNQKEVE